LKVMDFIKELYIVGIVLCKSYLPFMHGSFASSSHET
jgi:hypothetical protein